MIPPTASVRTDYVHISQIPCVCIIGILPNERITPQTVLIDVNIGLDLSACATTCDLKFGIDYVVVAHDICQLLQKAEFRLIETACAALGKVILAKYPSIQSITVTLKKIAALHGIGVPGVSMTQLSRERFAVNDGNELRDRDLDQRRDDLRNLVFRCDDLEIYLEPRSGDLLILTPKVDSP